MGLYHTPFATPGRWPERQGAQRNARRNMHQTQIAVMLSPTQTAAAPRAPRAARFSDRFAPLWASTVLPSPSRRIEGAPGRAAQLLAAGTTSIMAILPGLDFLSEIASGKRSEDLPSRDPRPDWPYSAVDIWLKLGHTVFGRLEGSKSAAARHGAHPPFSCIGCQPITIVPIAAPAFAPPFASAL